MMWLVRNAECGYEACALASRNGWCGMQSVGMRPVHWHQDVAAAGTPQYRGSLDSVLRQLDVLVADLEALGVPLDSFCLTALINVS